MDKVDACVTRFQSQNLKRDASGRRCDICCLYEVEAPSQLWVTSRRARSHTDLLLYREFDSEYNTVYHSAEISTLTVEVTMPCSPARQLDPESSGDLPAYP